MNILQRFYNNKNRYYWLNIHNLNYSVDNKINTIYWNVDVFVIEIEPVVALNYGVHNVKFVVSLAVYVHVEADVPP